MAEIPLGNQPFDLVFHPTKPLLYVALLTGHVTAFSYTHEAASEEAFQYEQKFSVRPTKRSCRGLATSGSGDRLYTVTKDKTMHEIDTSTGAILNTTIDAHEFVCLFGGRTDSNILFKFSLLSLEPLLIEYV